MKSRLVNEVEILRSKPSNRPTPQAPAFRRGVLTALGSIALTAGWKGSALQMCTFLENPIIALAVGLVFAIAQLGTAEKLNAFYFLYCRRYSRIIRAFRRIP
ncbi:MAG: hypothetical protein LBG73_04225 [Spirochaetaceae bacterium]|jgi:hypothetical protein|nr:hypothetical protein [Spirochaetaceae bacterium]